MEDIRCESYNATLKAGKMNELSAVVMNRISLETHCKMKKASCRIIYTMAIHSASIYTITASLCQALREQW